MDEVNHALLQYALEAVWCLEPADEGIASSIEWQRTHRFAYRRRLKPGCRDRVATPTRAAAGSALRR